MSSSLSDSALEKKFQGATNTQDSIQTLSLWLLHHKSNHQKIVAHWLKVLQKAKINHRLTLFYLANDVIQNSKRKGFLLFVNSFAEVLKEATLLVRNDQIRSNIQRVFSIWEQRNVYSADFIADLQAILTNSKVPSTAPSKLLADFKPDLVIKKLRSVLKLEMEASSKQSSINFTKLNATESEIVQQFKDRIHGQQFSRDFDKSIKQLEELIDIKEKEVNERSDLILILEQSSIYYDTQKSEAKIVANAYKNFDGRVKTLQKKLTELSATLPSPLPSPSVDAPSPTNSDLEVELDLPNDNGPSGMSSLLGAFTNKNKSEPKGGDSLDHRLSSLLQNIPNLPLFAADPPAPEEKGSGQNTPLQDEDTSPFPNRDLLKSLTGLMEPSRPPLEESKPPDGTPLQPPSFFASQNSFIQTTQSSFIQTTQPSFIPTTQNSFIQASDPFNPTTQSSFIQGSDPFNPTTQSASQNSFMQSSDPFNPTTQSSFIQGSDPFNTTTQNSFIDSGGPFNQPTKNSFVDTGGPFNQPTKNSFVETSQPFNPGSQNSFVETSQPFNPSTQNSFMETTQSFNNAPPNNSFVEAPQSSFIPSLGANPHFDEYNPEAELFNTDMDLDDENSSSSPPSRIADHRRLSTLITVVTDDHKTERGGNKPWPPPEDKYLAPPNDEYLAPPNDEYLAPPDELMGPPDDDFLPPPFFNQHGPRWGPPRPHFQEKRRPFRGGRRPWGRPPPRYYHNGR